MKTPKYCKGCAHLKVAKLPKEGIPYCLQHNLALTDRIASHCKAVLKTKEKR